MNKCNETKLLADVTKGLGISLIVIDDQDKVQFANWIFGEVLGAAPATGEALADALDLPNGDRDAFVDQLHQPGDGPYTVTARKMNGGEHLHAFKVTVSRITWHEAPAASVRIEDVSNEQNLFKEVENLERLASAGQMAAGIAHEFNNILTAMMGWTQLGLAACDGNQQVTDALHTIDNNTRRARKIASDLLEITRPQQPAEKQHSVAVDEAVREALKLLAWDISNAHVKVFEHVDPTRTCRGNATRLVQVFVNIIRNALDAMPDRGNLEVAVREEGDEVHVSFSDSGMGIPEDVIGSIFQPFFTTKMKGDNVHGGNGLGLAISSQIIKDFGGSISATNMEQGGTRVTVSMPIEDRLSEESIPVPQTPSSLPPGVAVLVIDDEPDICEMIRTALTLRGVHVVSSTDGESAVEMCRKEMFNAAFVDYSMSGLSGHDLGRAIKEVQPNLPIIYMSGVEIPLNGSSVDTDFLKKPFDLNEIQVKLRELLDRAGA